MRCYFAGTNTNEKYISCKVNALQHLYFHLNIIYTHRPMVFCVCLQSVFMFILLFAFLPEVAGPGCFHMCCGGFLLSILICYMIMIRLYQWWQRDSSQYCDEFCCYAQCAMNRNTKIKMEITVIKVEQYIWAVNVCIIHVLSFSLDLRSPFNICIDHCCLNYTARYECSVLANRTSNDSFYDFFLLANHKAIKPCVRVRDIAAYIGRNTAIGNPK